MENIVINRCGASLPPLLCRILPPAVTEALFPIADVEEIRLSSLRQVWVRADGRNLPLNLRLDRKELDDVVTRMCGGSLYAHSESICHGYIPLGDGLRAGICGRVAMENGKITGIYDISSVTVRVPHRIRVEVSELTALLNESRFTRGVLVYAPPGGGKTTYLRSAARCLASGEQPRRVVVVDTRDELAFSLESANLCLDILSGYPKGYGVEIAVRTLGAEVIVCDEIGSEEEATAILAVQSGGVPLIASTHASGVRDLLSRRGIAMLHRAGVFAGYIGLSRGGKPVVTREEDADACL